MFDVNQVSHMLKEARIKKNLTQSALAEQLGVTYQAVSNWERGASLPDISNLSMLCNLLGLDLYKLVGASQNPELAEEILSNPGTLNDAPIDAIAAVAPMLPPEQLMEMVRAKKDDIHNLATLVQLAPFTDADLIEELGAELTPSHIGEVVELSPFVTNRLCAKWIEKLESMEGFDLDVGLLSELGPYLSQEKMDQLSERVIPDNLIVLDSVAPFLSSDALCRLAKRVEHITLNDYIVSMECLMPFLGRATMEQLHKKVVDC